MTESDWYIQRRTKTDKKKGNFGLSSQQERFVRQSLAAQVFLYHKTIIKNHKTINNKGEFPSKLVIHYTNFPAIFSKLYYLEKNKDYGQDKILTVTSHHIPSIWPEGKLEEIIINKDQVIITSINDIHIYRPIKLETIKKLMNLFSKWLISSAKKQICLCFYLINFRMSTSFVYFDGFFYKYLGGVKKEQELEMVSYKSAFLYNLVTYYLFLKAKNLICLIIYHKIYRDDGLILFKGKNKVQ